ncbi:phage tail tip domain-containing protein [Escherichia coli]
MLNQETAKAARTDSGYILRAPRRMRVADAVAQYMRVPMGAGNSVPWDPLVAPYVIEPMNCLASREYDAVIFVGPARTGKTIGLIDGWVIYNVICDPADMLIIQMTEEKAREHSKKRLARTFRVSPEVVSRLSPNKNDNNVYDRTFLAGNYLKIGWPSVNIMSSSDYKCVALTDYDRFPEDIDGEGDAFSLASKRTTTFMSSGMTLVESSPGRDVKDVKWRRTSPHEAPPTTGITESHLGKELLEKVELTEDNASKLEEFSKEWKDASDKWNAMWGVKIEQTKDGKHYVAGIGLSMEDTEEGKLSQFLVAANRIAFIDPSNGNTRPMFVGQGDQIFMNDVFLKRLTAPTITSGGNPPAFSLTPDGRLTAKNADISGNVNANSGTLNNVTINENCRVLGKLSANQIEGDLVKTVGKAFPRDSRAPERWPSGTITVRVYDDQPFDRQIVIPAVAFSGAKHEREHTDIYSSCRLIVRKNGAEIYNRTALDNTLIYSGVIDMPAGHGHMTLEFSVSAWLVNDWYPTASISDLLVVVMKKATAGISIS